MMMPVRRTNNWTPSIFNEFFGNGWMEKSNFAAPAVNIIENANEFKVEFAAPGATKDDFRIEMKEENLLLVSMEKKASKEEKSEDKYLRREFSHVSFSQTVVLPDNINREKIEAKVKEGVLTVVLPKKTEEEKAQKSTLIQIN